MEGQHKGGLDGQQQEEGEEKEEGKGSGGGGTGWVESPKKEEVVLPVTTLDASLQLIRNQVLSKKYSSCFISIPLTAPVGWLLSRREEHFFTGPQAKAQSLCVVL